MQISTTPLIVLLGFAIGAALYAMLLVMVVRNPVTERVRGAGGDSSSASVDFLLLATGVLGLLWNLGGLFEWLSIDLIQSPRNPLVTAIAYTALGFLPAVVVHSVFQKSAEDSEIGNIGKSRLLTIAAYSLSGFAAAWHLFSVVRFDFAPSYQALRVLTFGYLFILAALLISSLRQSVGRKALWATALAVFAISALHLSRPHTHDNSWVMELVGHQASLPLALAILYQDFRFAFADLFLKRALSLLIVTVAATGFYWLVAGYFYTGEMVMVSADTKFIAANISFWVATALLFPSINRFTDWFVNNAILRRVSYNQLQNEIMRRISRSENADSALYSVCDELRSALTVSKTNWHRISGSSGLLRGQLVHPRASGADLLIPTSDQPNYQITLDNFIGGRRLLSEEITMLEDVALMTARRIDGLRVTHERCEQELREHEFSKLATEAELRALRAQINPHFLFNALTTVSYLIKTSPDKANDTLMRLTKLLRGVLRSTDEFLTLGEEIMLVESYLEIERARFEERLTVEIDVPDNLRNLKIPSLILQPIVENAIKHGISPKKEGGRIEITASKSRGQLVLTVYDTGNGIGADDLRVQREQRIGLNNVEDRLRLYFQENATLKIESRIGFGTNVQIKISLEKIGLVLSRNMIAPSFTLLVKR